MSVGQLPPAASIDAWTSTSVEAALLAMTSRRRAGGSRGPHRLAALLHALGDPHTRAPVVKVVGTDGKTSVTRLLAALATASGDRVGATTSPHLQRIDERIRVDGAPAAPHRLGPALDRADDAVAIVEAAWGADASARAGDQPAAMVGQRAGERLTFFEVVTATALQVFADAAVDLAVVEAGIGGIGDATAAVASEVVVLTPVGLDHPQLGSTRAEVAREKVGVLPPGGTLVSAPQRPDVEAVLAEVVAERDGHWLRAGVDHRVLERHPDADGQTVTILGPDGAMIQVWLPLWGSHQAENAATALAALYAVQGGWPAPDTVRTALAAVAVPGRTEQITGTAGPEVVLDGAHDLPATDALLAALAERPVAGPTVVLLGATGGRDVEVLSDRLAAAGEVVDHVEPGAGDADLSAALACARSRAGVNGRVVVTGSLHLVGAVRSLLAARPADPSGYWPVH